MSRLQNLYNLAIDSIFFWPPSLALLALVLSSAKIESKRAVSLLAWLQFASPLIMLLLGELFRCPRVLACPSTDWMTLAVYFLLISQPPIALYILWEVRRYKFPILAFSFIQLVFSFLAGLAASMSISGDWL